MNKKQKTGKEDLQNFRADKTPPRSTNLTQDVDDVVLRFSDEAVEKLQKARGENKIDHNKQNPTAEIEIEKQPRFYEKAYVSKGTITPEERKMAMYAAEAFKPVNPFCRVVLCPLYLYKGCVVHLPSCFAKNHLNGVSGWIKRQNSDGKQWLVRCVSRAGSIKLIQGWYEFSLEIFWRRRCLYAEIKSCYHIGSYSLSC
ncbi:conserved hypothetical protein [Ricinus communis]|uniref:Uncharacterized protein n=1 Tax=Ricinus communis TaxID=3988 RepID=B9RZH3_RICCO|nr:conserved hypothetical protein [Ricinus communis]